MTGSLNCWNVKMLVFLAQIKCRTTDDKRLEQSKPKFWWFNSNVLQSLFLVRRKKTQNHYVKKCSDGNREYLMFEKRPVEKVNTGKPVLREKLLFYCCINCGGRNRPSSLHLSHVKSKKWRVVLFRTNRVDAGVAAVDVSLSQTGEINTLGGQKLLFRVFFDFFFCGATEQRHIWRGATPVTPVSRQPKHPRMKQSHETIKSRWSAGNLSHDEKKNRNE